MEKAKKVRADVALVERGLAESREKAQALIMSGVVYVDEVKVDKASQAIKPEDNLLVRGAAHPYVSRGGLKLEKALKVFHYDPTGVWRWIWARRPAGLPTCCCKTARGMCTASTWASASWTGASATTSA